MFTLPAISLSCGCAAKMTFCVFSDVDLDVVVDSDDGDAVFGRYVIDGALFACPFLLGWWMGRLETSLSYVVDAALSFSTSSGRDG